MRQLIDLAMQQYEALGVTLKEIDAMVPKVITVPVVAGDSLQAAFESLYQTGGVLSVGPGRFGKLTLAERQDAPLIVVRGVGPATELDGFDTALGRNVTFENLDFVADGSLDFHINFGRGRTRGADGIWRHTVNVNPETTPSGFIFRNVNGRGTLGTRRGITANVRNLLLEDVHLTGYCVTGQDSQAISGYNGTFNVVARRCTFEAASENIIFGGADAASELMYPQDIIIEDSILTKRPEWDGAGLNLKCLVELKNCQGFAMTRCQLSGCWADAWGWGLAIMLKASNQEGTNPAARSENVEISYNTITNVGAFLRIQGRNPPSLGGIVNNVRFHHNTCSGMHANGDGRAVAISDGPQNVVIDHNTFPDNRHSALDVGDPSHPAASVAYTNNIVRHGTYGMLLRNALSVIDIRGNAIEQRPSGTQWVPPAGSGNVYYPAPILSQDLTGQVTTDGSAVGV